MAVTAAMIKELRAMTGIGMSNCKKALVEADGNMDRAVEILREKGLAAAVKKSARIAAEGISYAKISEDGKTAVVVEVNAETDFVAKNEKFRDYVDSVANQAVASKADDIDGFLAEKWYKDTTLTVAEALSQMIAVIGENIKIRRFEKFKGSDNSVMVSYLHAGGKVAVLLELETDAKSDEVIECGKNICMQIAAMNPRFVDQSEISDEFLAKEREIYTQQAKQDEKNANKPEKAIMFIIEGRLKKELKEICLVDQEYIKAEKKESVKEYLNSVSKALGKSIAVKRFARFETGEGIEKKQEDFAAEVEKAVKG